MSLGKTSTAMLLILSFISNYGIVSAEPGAPMVTAAAQLLPRANDPQLVGYISQNGAYLNPARSCDPTETVSTSAGYFQCCPTSGSSCAFYTACQDNTLQAAGGVTVDCYVNSGLTCNTGIVLASAGAESGASYLACWQTSLGSAEFTIVQTTGAGDGAGVSGSSTGTLTNSGAAASSTSVGASSQPDSSAPTSTDTSSSGSGTSGSSESSSTSSSNIAGAAGEPGGIVGMLLAVVAPLLL